MQSKILRVLGVAMAVVLVVSVGGLSAWGQEGDDALKKKYAPLLGEYEFDMDGQVMLVIAAPKSKTREPSSLSILGGVIVSLMVANCENGAVWPFLRFMRRDSSVCSDVRICSGNFSITFISSSPRWIFWIC